MAPQDIHTLILRTSDCYIIRQKQQAVMCVCVGGWIFQDMINLRIEDKQITLDYLGGSQMRLHMLL